MSMRAVLGDTKEGDAREALEASIRRHDLGPLSPITRSRGLGPYRGYAEMLAAVAHLADSGARLVRYGRSVEGEPLFALHFGRVAADSEGKASSHLSRTAVVLSGIHPTEWIGIETHLAMLARLVGADIGDRAVIAMPIANPDGIRRVERNLRAGKKRFVRHNARGVDLNRNFDARWGKLGIVQRLLSFVYAPGSRPASEPEVEGIAHHLSAVRIDRAVSLHSFGGAVLFPRASSVFRIHDEAEHRVWARRIATAADPKRPYVFASCARWSKGITAGGLELDWFYDRHGAVSLLVECSRGGLGFTPSRLFDPFAWFNPPRIAQVTGSIADGVLPFVKGLDA